MSGRRISSPRFRREGIAPKIKLTPDDIAILVQVHRHRFVRADDLYRLMPERTPDRLSRRLTLLFRNEMLDRPVSQIDRYREGGSKALVYGLGSSGAKYLKETLGVAIGPTDWRSRNHSYTRQNLDHTLEVSRFLIDLELICRERDDLSLIFFDEILSNAPEATRRSAKAAQWPVQVKHGSVQGIVNLIPDAIFGLRHRSENDNRIAYFFVEVDRGTMTVAPAARVQESEAFLHRSTILRKVVSYAESWRQELHNRHFGLPSTRTIFITTGEARATAIRQAAHIYTKRLGGIPEGLILFGASGGDVSQIKFRNLTNLDVEILPP